MNSFNFIQISLTHIFNVHHFDGYMWISLSFPLPLWYIEMKKSRINFKHFFRSSSSNATSFHILYFPSFAHWTTQHLAFNYQTFTQASIETLTNTMKRARTLTHTHKPQRSIGFEQRVSRSHRYPCQCNGKKNKQVKQNRTECVLTSFGVCCSFAYDSTGLFSFILLCRWLWLA